MTVQVFYQRALWLPLAVPAFTLAAAALFVRVGGRLPGEIRAALGWLGYSVIFGAIPYALLAMWATWWIERQTEPQIERLMFLSPFLMAATFAVIAIIAFLLRGAPVTVAVATAIFGGVFSIIFGYGYVGVVILLRRLLANRIV